MNCDYCGAERVVRIELKFNFIYLCPTHFRAEMEFRRKLNKATRELYRTKRMLEKELDRALLPIFRFKELFKSQKEEREIRNALSLLNQKRRSL